MNRSVEEGRREGERGRREGEIKNREVKIIADTVQDVDTIRERKEGKERERNKREIKRE